jgi:hypothetical protein
MNANEDGRPLAMWAGAAILAIVTFTVLSAAFGKDGDGNDPLIAEVGNIGSLIAVAALLVIALVGLAGRLRGGEAR